MDEEDGEYIEEYSVLRYIGGRKFTLSVLIVIISSVLLYLGKLESNLYAQIIMMVIGAYIAGNVYQNVSLGTAATKANQQSN